MSFKTSILPEFPDLKPLTIEDKDAIEKITHPYPPYSDYSFTSLMTWNIDNQAQLASLNGNLVLRFNDYVTGEPFYSFFGPNNVLHTAQVLMSQSIKQGFSPQLKLIPEISIQAAPELFDEFIIQEDPDNFDYVYSVPETAALIGGKYAERRNFVNRFTRLYKEQFSHRKINSEDPTVAQEVLELFETWEKARNKTGEETANELMAVKRILQYADILKPFTVGLFTGGKLAGFTMNDITSNHYAVTSFEKADSNYQGIFAYLRYITMTYLLNQGCEHLNFEQDLGIPGLRKSKQAWAPNFFLKKYIISPKS